MENDRKYTEAHAAKFLEELTARLEEEEKILSQYKANNYELFHKKLNRILEYILKNRKDLMLRSVEYDVHCGTRLWDIEGVHQDEMENIFYILAEVYPETDYENLNQEEHMFLQERHVFTWREHKVFYSLYAGQGEHIHELSIRKNEGEKPYIPTKIRCNHCGSVIFSKTPAKRSICRCRKVSIEETKRRLLIDGDKEDYEIMEEK